PSPRLPVILTSARSQPRTSTLPLRLSISTRPRGSSGLAWLIGVAAWTGAAMLHANANTVAIRKLRMSNSSSVERAAREREPACVGCAQAFEQQARIRIVLQRCEDLDGTAIQRIESGLPTGRKRCEFHFPQCAFVVHGHAVGFA